MSNIEENAHQTWHFVKKHFQLLFRSGTGSDFPYRGGILYFSSTFIGACNLELCCNFDGMNSRIK